MSEPKKTPVAELAEQLRKVMGINQRDHAQIYALIVTLADAVCKLQCGKDATKEELHAASVKLASEATRRPSGVRRARGRRVQAAQHLGTLSSDQR